MTNLDSILKKQRPIILQKQIEKEVGFVVTRSRVGAGGAGVGGDGEEELHEVSQKVQTSKPPVIRQISSRDIMYNMVNIINTAVCYT